MRMFTLIPSTVYTSAGGRRVLMRTEVDCFCKKDSLGRRIPRTGTRTKTGRIEVSFLSKERAGQSGPKLVGQRENLWALIAQLVKKNTHVTT